MDLLMAISAEEKRCSFKLTLYPARSAAWLAMLACARDGRGREGLSGKSNLEECPSRKWKMENVFPFVRIQKRVQISVLLQSDMTAEYGT